MSIDHQEDGGGQPLVQPPSHPVPQLQKPFEESMMESMQDADDHDMPADAVTRRTLLLEAPTYQRVIAGRWRQKPDEKYHPLWKLVAQLSFGMHLLAQDMAISEEEVMRILQSHVDDIDAFLERTTEDFELAQSDVHERIRCLKLPLAHGDVFDRMLEDRAFRASILDGNEKIDHVISRTKKAARDALKDVQKGFDATNVLEKYLANLSTTWRRDSPEHEAVLVAMLGNVEGWRRAFLELHLRGNKLSGSLKKLAEVVSEMERRAAAVSRDILAREQKRRYHSPQKNSRSTSKTGLVTASKPLPSEPGRRQATRNSSSSTQRTTVSSRPTSGHKSSQALASPTSNRSRQSPAAKRGAATPRPSERSVSSEAAGLEDARTRHGATHAPNIGGLVGGAADHGPIELPADVPRDALRHAPVSIKNRLSMTLGRRTADLPEHRVSSVYYPKALADLLKTSALGNWLPTPKAAKSSKATPVHAVVPSQATPHAHDDAGAGHLPSAAVVDVAEGDPAAPLFVTPPAVLTGSARASIVGSSPATRRSSVPNAAFTSHTAVMSMATPPAELPGDLDLADRPSSPSQLRDRSHPSSLGEPGPELADGVTTRSTSMSNILLSPVGGDTEKHRVRSLPEPEETGLPRPQEDPESRGAVAAAVVTPVMDLGSPPLADGAMTAARNPPEPPHSDEPTTMQTDDHGRGTAPVAHEQSHAQEGSGVAELEATPHKSPPRPLSPRGTEPVELEAPAPRQTFRLPPAPSRAGQDEEGSRAQIQRLDDFFKLPTEPAIAPGTHPSGGTDVAEPDLLDPMAPVKFKLTKKDGKLVPVQVTARVDAEPADETRPALRTDLVADIIDTMSSTPAGSPRHTLTGSSASQHSAQRWSQRSSRSLAPPQQAPPPPGPGGRPMVDPDFASAGQFEGERKHKKTKSAGGSKSGWKSFFSGGTSLAFHSSKSSKSGPVNGDETAGAGVGAGASGPDATSAPYGRELMTTSGKDVLWFKGDAPAKKPVGVSAA